MKLKNLIHEDFVQYKKPSMFLGTTTCDWKCLKEKKLPITICQNCELAKADTIEVDNEILVKRYVQNPITSSVVFGGLEPMFDIDDICDFIYRLREYNDDDVVIYTGYYPHELEKELEMLQQFKNIIVKFGRFVPNDKSKFDEILGIELASSNQYALKVS